MARAAATTNRRERPRVVLFWIRIRGRRRNHHVAVRRIMERVEIAVLICWRDGMQGVRGGIDTTTMGQRRIRWNRERG
jgi:hypothetical protein